MNKSLIIILFQSILIVNIASAQFDKEKQPKNNGLYYHFERHNNVPIMEILYFDGVGIVERLYSISFSGEIDDEYLTNEFNGLETKYEIDDSKIIFVYKTKSDNIKYECETKKGKLNVKIYYLDENNKVFEKSKISFDFKEFKK